MESYDDIETVLLNIQKLGFDNFIIITGGIGDFLILDSFFSFYKTKNIIFISLQSIHLKKLMKDYDYNCIKNYYALYFNFSKLKRPGFNSNKELLINFPIFNEIPIKIVSICDYFPTIRKKISNKLICDSNIFMNEIVKTDIKQIFRLPKIYAVICPFTEDKRIDCVNCNYFHVGYTKKCKFTRNFIHKDYINILEYLKNNNIVGVVISKEKIYIDENQYNVINYSASDVSLMDCIEIVKQSTYYFGVDGLFSIVANKILENNKIYIKCNNKHAHRNKDIYWYPNKDIRLQPIIKIKCRNNLTTFPHSSESEINATFPHSFESEINATFPHSSESEINTTFPHSSESEINTIFPHSSESEINTIFPHSSESEINTIFTSDIFELKDTIDASGAIPSILEI